MVVAGCDDRINWNRFTLGFCSDELNNKQYSAQRGAGAAADGANDGARYKTARCELHLLATPPTSKLAASFQIRF